MFSRKRRTPSWGVALVAVAMAWACGKRQEQPGTGPSGQKPPSASAKAPLGPPKPLPAIFRAMPEATIVAVALTDLDKFRADFKGTTLYEVWNDPSNKTWRETRWPKLRALFDERAGITLQEIDDLLHGDVLLLMTSRALSRGDKPDAQLTTKTIEARTTAAVLFRATTNKSRLDAVVQKLFAKMGGPSLPAYKWVGDILVTAEDQASADALADNLQSERSPLEGKKAYDVLRSLYNEQGFFHVWVNVEEIIRSSLAGKDSTQRTTIEEQMKQIGAMNVTSVYLTSAIHQKGLFSRWRVQFAGDRQGIFALAGSNAPPKALSLTPGDANSFLSIRHVGMNQLIQTVRELVSASSDSGKEEWEQTSTAVNEALGINIETDLPPLVGKEITVSVSGAGLAVVANLLIESPKPAALVDRIDKRLADWSGAIRIQTWTGEHEGIRYRYVSTPGTPLPFQFSYGAVGGYVVVSTQQAGVQAAIDIVKGKRPSLAGSEQYAKAMASVGKPGWMESVSGLNPQPNPALAFIVPGILKGINETFGANLEAADVPNLSPFFEPRQPSASRSRAYANAIEFERHSKVASITGMGLAAAIAVPGFLRAREMARSVACQSNLIKIEGAVDQWAVEHDKKDGATVTMSELVGPSKYLKRTPRCRGGGNYPEVLTVGQPPMCDYRFPAWLDTRDDRFKHVIPAAKP